jgi:hypothetical protein
MISADNNRLSRPQNDHIVVSDPLSWSGSKDIYMFCVSSLDVFR